MSCLDPFCLKESRYYYYYYYLGDIKDRLHNMTKRSTHYAVGHQGSLDKTRQNISGVVLVVRHPGQAGVKRHHDEGELGQRAQQTRSVPSETRLQVKLEKTHRVFETPERLTGGPRWVLVLHHPLWMDVK